MAERGRIQRLCKFHNTLATLRVKRKGHEHIDKSVIHHGRLAVFFAAIGDKLLSVLLDDFFRRRICNQDQTGNFVLLVVSITVLTIQTIDRATIPCMTIVAIVAYFLMAT